MPINDIIESVSDTTVTDIFNIIFHSSYYPGIFAIQCIYTCFFLRFAEGGIQWYRSIILGFLLAYSPRWLLGICISRVLPELSDKSAISTYAIVWCILNIFPFDLVYHFLNRTVSRTVLTALSGFAEGVLLLNNIWALFTVFPDNIPRGILTIAICYIGPNIIHFADGIIFGQYRPIMIYPFHYVKRILLISTVAIFVSQPISQFPGSPYVSIYDLIPPISIANAVLRLLDVVAHSGHPFLMLDFVFPKLFIYYLIPKPLREERRMRAAKREK